jgi:hypothetical protein
MGVNNPTYSQIIGNADAIELSPKRKWNPVDGVQTFRRFSGTSDAIIAKFNELSATTGSGVDELDEDISGKSGTLLARIIEDSGGSIGGNTEELNAVWEVRASPLNKPIEAHSDFDSVTVLRKRAIEKAARDATALTDPAPSDAEKKLYAYYSNQVLDFVLTELEITKSTILSSRSAIVASYASMNRVVTLASIAPPTTLLGVLTSLPKMDGSSGAWEWLKLCPQLRQVARAKFQLSYSWRGAERWAEIYGGSWTPTYG